MTIRISAINEIRDGSLRKIHPIILLLPEIFAASIKNTAGKAKIAAKIDKFSILFDFNYSTNIKHSFDIEKEIEN